MIVTILGWLVLECLLWWFFLYFGSSVALAFAVLMLVVPLTSIPVNLRLCKRIVAQVEAAVSQRKNAEGIITIRLENPTLLPILKIRCVLMVQNQLNREVQTQSVLTHLPPRKTQTSELVVDSRYCGRLRIWISRITLYDCFGLIGIRCKCDAVTHMTILPDTFEPVVSLIPNPSSSDDSESYSQERPGFDMTETFQLREYVPGDSLRQVHWKLTGKLDKLIVRDPGLPIAKNVLVFWERAGETEDPALIDAQAEVVISLCRSLTDNGIQFHVGWNDTDRNLCILHRINNMDEFVAITPRLLRATGAKDGVSGAGLLLQTRAEALCAHMVYIAQEPQDEVAAMQRYGHVTMLLCGGALPDGAVYFNAVDYVQQLSEIEI